MQDCILFLIWKTVPKNLILIIKKLYNEKHSEINNSNSRIMFYKHNDFCTGIGKTWRK